MPVICGPSELSEHICRAQCVALSVRVLTLPTERTVSTPDFSMACQSAAVKSMPLQAHCHTVDCASLIFHWQRLHIGR